MEHYLSKEAPNRIDIYNLHKSFGVLVFGLVALRIINRLIYTPPALPNSLLKSEKILAHITHFTLYFLMVAVPLSGYLMSNLFGYTVSFFGTRLPSIIKANPDFGMVIHDSHAIFAYIFLSVIVLHIAGALKHRFFDKPENDVLKRMF